MKKALLLFVFWLLPLGFALQREPSFPGQDPIVEEAIRCVEKDRLAPSKGQKLKLWELWTKLEELERMAKNPTSKAFICWLRARIRPLLENTLPWWVFKRDYCPHLLTPEDRSALARCWDVPEKERAPYIIYDPFYGPYLQATGRYQEALQRIQDGTIVELYRELRRHFEEERENLCIKAGEYDPYIATTWVYFEDTDRVYYTTALTWREIEEWERQILSYETEKRLGNLRDKLSKEEYDKQWKIVYEKVSSEFDRRYNPAFYLLKSLAEVYAKRGDYEKAIRYWELFTSIEGRVQIMWVGPSPLDEITPPKVREWRANYLKQLKAQGEVDKLHPFIYINDKPLNPKKGFTKGGEPYVSVLDFSKAIGASAEWERAGKLLKIKSEDDALLIANIKGRWKVYTEEGKKDINAYFKDGELYLPLKELCKLLNLELKWDEETFIAHVFKK